MPANKKIFIDLRRRKGYRNKIENLNREDSNLTLTIKLKAVAAKNNETARNHILSRQVASTYTQCLGRNLLLIQKNME